jgi:internalin A
VLGGKTAREIAEQQKIDELENGIGDPLNKRNPIGLQRWHLMAAALQSTMTSGPCYVFEDSPRGRSLVVTGPWSDDTARALARGEADGLVLNYARGFCESSLDLLDGGWPLRRLSVLDRSIVDLGPIGRLVGLEELSVQAAADTVLDLGVLPGLRSLTGDWALMGHTLGAVAELERVVTWMFDDVDLHAFRDHIALKTLTIKDAPYLESLSGLGNLPDLAAVTVVGAPGLHEIDEVAGLSASLRELKFEECPRINAIDDVESLVGLRLLGISECGDIASLAPVRSLKELETLYAWGSTRIIDGDLFPLAQLPRLTEIRMRNRRGYKPAVADLVSALSA